MLSKLLVLALIAIIDASSAFLILPSGQHGGHIVTSHVRPSIGSAFHRRSMTSLYASSNEDESSSTSTKKKRRRKVALPAELLEEEQQQQAPSPPSTVAEEASEASSNGQEVDLQERLKQDIARFRKAEVAEKELEPQVTGVAALAGKAASAFEKVLVADFFVVLGFLGWFLTGVLFKAVLEDRSVLDSFNKIWDPVIQPALGILMAGTLGVGVINNVAKRSEEAGKS